MMYPKHRFSLLIVFTLSVLIAASALAQNASIIAVALTVSGTVECKKGDKDWQPLAFGSLLSNGDQLRTGETGFAAIAFTDDKSQVKLRPNSTITLLGERNEDYSIAKRINMELGELYSAVKKQKGSMQVATPTAVASVKGTEFWVLLDENGQTSVLNLEGLIEMLSLLTGESAEIIAGQIGTVDPSGTLEIGKFTAAQVPTLDKGDEGIHSVEIIFTDEEGNLKRVIIDLKVE